MKVILVDDEPLVIEHMLQLIPWNEHGFEVAATAYNGETALNLCEEHRPQIVIVDIRMPVMDGLELIEAVSAKEQGVKFIVMSAYKDFEFAQQAIKLGVSSYLVKHTVNHDKLLEELKKAKAAWESDQSGKRILLGEQVKNVLTGNGSSPALTGKLIGQLGIIFIQLDIPFSLDRNPLHQKEPKWGSAAFEEITSNEVPHHPDWTHIGQFAPSQFQYVILFSSKNKGVGAALEFLHELAVQWQRRSRLLNGQTLSVYYSVHTTGAGNLPHAYAAVRLASQCSIFSGKEARVSVNNVPLPVPTAAPFPYQEDRFEDLTAGFEQGKWEVLEEGLRVRLQSVQHPHWDLPSLYELIDALHKLLKTLQRQYAPSGHNETYEIPPIYEVSDIQAYLLGRFRRLLNGTSLTGNKVSSKLAAAIQHIQNHFHEEISVDQVAYAIGISASYLHLLFKRELGRTFLDYLTEFRISQAKRILKKDNVKMSEVAAKVGYRSAPYFSQVFKKATGLLPHDYRERADLL
jgi:two-component system response regulator YesN